MNDFMQGICKLEMAYNQRFTKEKQSFWWNKLRTMDSTKYIKKIDKLIQEKQYMPNIAEILDKKEKLSNFQQRDYSNYDFDKLYANKE